MKFLQILLLVSVGVALVSSRATQNGKRLIKTSEEKPGQWMTEIEIFDLIKSGTTFIDITESSFDAANDVAAAAIPTELRFQETVSRVTNNLNGQRVEDFVRHFSSYHNRYYTSQTGRESQLWLLSEAQKSIENYAGSATVEEVDHGYLQKSVVARLEGAHPTLKSEVVVFGAHLDSVNLAGSSLQAPGADDNASGSSVVLETLRAIVEAGVVLNKTVEFHWYAAEEIGLRGSQAIAEEYKRTNVNVIAMMNMDVVGYYVEGINDIGVFTDNGHASVIQFLRILADEYLSFGRRDSTCGYGCSDHASWTRAGYPAAMASEYVTHPQMHTVRDNVDHPNFSFTQINEFVKLAIGFVVELGEPSRP